MLALGQNQVLQISAPFRWNLCPPEHLTVLKIKTHQYTERNVIPNVLYEMLAFLLHIVEVKNSTLLVETVFSVSSVVWSFQFCQQNTWTVLQIVALSL
jgi:hypothetical protein